MPNAYFKIIILFSLLIGSSMQVFAACEPVGSINAIKGESAPCQESTYTYSVAPVLNATSYIWTLPSGTSGRSTSENISITINNAVVNGIITVKAVNECSESDEATITISSLSPTPATPSTISGLPDICNGKDSLFKALVDIVPEASTYLWILPDGNYIQSSYNYIFLPYGEKVESLQLSVSAVNKCGTSNASQVDITVFETPDKPQIVKKGEQLLICVDSGMYNYEWHKNNTPLNNEQKQFLELDGDKTGIYNVLVTTIDGCSAMSDSIEIEATKSLNLSLTVAPNPISSNTIQFTLKSSQDEIVTYKLINSNGQLIKHGSVLSSEIIKQNTVYTDNLPTGIYYLVISNKSEIINKQIIVK